MLVPENIVELKVWHTGSRLTCRAKNKSSKVGMLKLSSEAADAFAHLVCVTLLRGIGVLYPFQCEGTIGWCWEATG